MFDLHSNKNPNWPESLAPIGEGGHNKESFEDWWERNSTGLSNLHPDIAEQWVYRHWHYSPYSFIDLHNLKWELKDWTTEQIIDAVYNERCQFNAEHDHKVFNRFDSNPTSGPMNATGTWDYPIVVMHVPHGIIDCDGEHPEVRHFLIEGHSRVRYLNALTEYGSPLGEHKVYVIAETD